MEISFAGHGVLYYNDANQLFMKMSSRMVNDAVKILCSCILLPGVEVNLDSIHAFFLSGINPDLAGFIMERLRK